MAMASTPLIIAKAILPPAFEVQSGLYYLYHPQEGVSSFDWDE